MTFPVSSTLVDILVATAPRLRAEFARMYHDHGAGPSVPSQKEFDGAIEWFQDYVRGPSTRVPNIDFGVAARAAAIIIASIARWQNDADECVAACAWELVVAPWTEAPTTPQS